MAVKGELIDFSFSLTPSLNRVVAAEQRYVNPIEFSHDLEACDTISFIYRHDDDNGHSGLGLGGRPCDILLPSSLSSLSIMNYWAWLLTLWVNWSHICTDRQ